MSTPKTTANIGFPDFSDLHSQGGTGRSYEISGTGRNRKYGYRRGVYCKLGDIEQSEWIAMMQDLIHRAGEDELHQQLLDWERKHNFCKRSEEDLTLFVLQSHSNRLFDNQEWVDFIKFNEQYRPDALIGVPVATAATECCGIPFITTQALLSRKGHQGTTCCQICGRWSKFQVLSDGCFYLVKPINDEEGGDVCVDSDGQ